jgi:lysophospholipase L1-like esterase
MKTFARITTCVLLNAFLVFAQGGAGSHWVTTWGTAPQQPRAAAAGQTGGFNNQTIRMIAHTSIGGRRVRVQFSNAFGTRPVAIGAAHIALRAKDSETVPGSDRALTFNGQPSATMLPGAPLLSDAVDLEVRPMSDLAVSIYVPGETGPASMHSTALHTTYISKEGDQTGQPSIPDATTRLSWFWLSGIEVMAPADAAVIVAFGDSITDGSASTPNTDRSWPAQLAQRLAAKPATAHLAVVNEGIGGNRLLADGAGVNALARFDRDVLSVAGVQWLMVLEGINDIGSLARPAGPGAAAVTADTLIGALRQMVERAHEHGIKVIGCTLTPYGGAGYSSDDGEAMREAVNKWIRSSGNFDAVVDFDAATRDPENPNQFRKDYNETDHLHPNDAGYKAMADAVDLAIFGKR